MTDIVFIGNQATGNNWSLAGGGMYNASFSQPKLTNVIFSGNQAVTGGGIYNNDSSPKLVNVIFSGNQANSGGGMSNRGTSTSTLINATFSRNQTNLYGGGIYNTANISLTNCILWNNEDYAGSSQDAQIYNSGGTVDVTYSLVQGVAVYPGTGNINSDPMFIDDDGSDSIVGTGDDNLRLRETSPAIDAGDNNTLASINLDLDNQPRFVDIPTVADTGNGTAPIVDMGAYEHPLTGYPLPPVANAGADQEVTTDSTVSLDGSASSDSNNQPLDYSWVQIGGSPLISFSNTLSKTTFVAPDTATVLTFGLTVANSNSLTDTDTIVITVTESLSPIYLPLILRQE
jgi:predicted outer membrane repeat protein